MDDADERLSVIAEIASALKDSLPGDNWHAAHAIQQVAEGKRGPAEALAELGW